METARKVMLIRIQMLLTRAVFLPSAPQHPVWPSLRSAPNNLLEKKPAGRMPKTEHEGKKGEALCP